MFFRQKKTSAGVKTDAFLWFGLFQCTQIDFVFHCFGRLVDFHKHDHIPRIIPYPINEFDISFAEYGCLFKFPALYSADSVHGGMYLEIVSGFGLNQFDTHSILNDEVDFTGFLSVIIIQLESIAF